MWHSCVLGGSFCRENTGVGVFAWAVKFPELIALEVPSHFTVTEASCGDGKRSLGPWKSLASCRCVALPLCAVKLLQITVYGPRPWKGSPGCSEKGLRIHYHPAPF